MGPCSSGNVRAEPQFRIGREGFSDPCSRKSETGQPPPGLHGKGGLKLLMCQDIESQFVRLAVKIREKSLFEDLVVGGHGHKQGQA